MKRILLGLMLVGAVYSAESAMLRNDSLPVGHSDERPQSQASSVMTEVDMPTAEAKAGVGGVKLVAKVDAIVEVPVPQIPTPLKTIKTLYDMETALHRLRDGVVSGYLRDKNFEFTRAKPEVKYLVLARLKGSLGDLFGKIAEQGYFLSKNAKAMNALAMPKEAKVGTNITDVYNTALKNYCQGVVESAATVAASAPASRSASRCSMRQEDGRSSVGPTKWNQNPTARALPTRNSERAVVHAPKFSGRNPLGKRNVWK